MVPDTSTPAIDASSTDDGFGRFIDGLIGGVVGIVLSFVPLSPLLGGAVAGYLEGGRPEDGLGVGAIAGLIMLVPFVLVLYFLLFLLGVGGAPSAFGVLALVVLFGSAFYTVGLSSLGATSART